MSLDTQDGWQYGRKLTVLLVILLIALLFLSLMVGCQPVRHHKKVKVHTYKVRNPGIYGQAQRESETWYYVIDAIVDNVQSYYYYSSPTEVTNFRTVQFTYSKTNPINEQDIEEQSEMEVADSSFANSLQEEIDTEFSETEADTQADAQAGSDGESSGGSDGGDGGGGDGGD